MNLFDLNGKTAIVTGAAGDIGAAIAFGCAEAGAQVILADINREAAAEVAPDIGARAQARRLDLGDIESFASFTDAVARDFGGIDILVNNAGIGIPKRGGCRSISWR